MFDAVVLKEFGRQTGLELRISGLRPFRAEIRRTNQQARERLFLNPENWTAAQIQRFYDFDRLLPGARSIVAAALGYWMPDEPDPSRPGRPYGLVARYTRRNYYLELRQRLRLVARFIKKEYGAAAAVFVNGPVPEKPIARRGGIGYYGKHSIIITPQFGSWCVLGEILTEAALTPDPPIKPACGSCRICLKACPTGAIIRPYVLDRRRCIQALTNWLGVIPDDIARVWENRVYGCTTCQEVCPKNAGIDFRHPLTRLGVVGQWLPLIDLLEMDEKSYRSRYARNQVSAAWIHFPAIQRNCLLALGNIRDPMTRPVIKRFLCHPEPAVAAAAQWAERRIIYG